MNEEEEDTFKAFLFWLRSEARQIKDKIEEIEAYVNVMLEEIGGEKAKNG